MVVPYQIPLRGTPRRRRGHRRHLFCPFSWTTQVKYRRFVCTVISTFDTGPTRLRGKCGGEACPEAKLVKRRRRIWPAYIMYAAVSSPFYRL